MQMLVLFAVFHMAVSSNILMTFSPITSHCLEMVGIGNELIKRGHTVSAYVPDFFDTKHCLHNSHIRPIEYKVTETNRDVYQLAIREIDRNVLTRDKTLFEILMFLAEGANALCDSQLSETSLLNELKGAGYDIVMTESQPFAHCYYLVPYYMGVPTVSVGSIVLGLDCGDVFQPYTYPHPIGPFTNEMTTLERILNAMHYIFFNFLLYVFWRSFDVSKYGKPFANVVPEMLIRESSLYLENSDYIADFPRATFPNFIQVGGLTIRPPEPLPNKLQPYLDDSKTGVILVSFGSFLNLESAEFTKRVASALKQLPYDVIFKLNNDSQDGNIKFIKWLPQNDVLSHPNIRLFVSHCGKNGVFESIYHSVPIVCFPLNGDAYQTAIKITHHRIGAAMDILTCTSDEMIKTITYVLNDSSIYSNMRRMSELFRDRPETGAERGARAIEHVIKYGAKHLKPTTNRLNYFQYTLCELWFVIFGCVLTVLSAVAYLIKLICCRKASVIEENIKKSN